MNKRIYYALILAAALAFIRPAAVHAGWPFNITPKIEGTITDAVTGRPVGNVIVSALWLKMSPSADGEVRKGMAYETVATDTNGRFVIPSKMTTHIVSNFGEIWVNVYHPLYATQSFRYSNDKLHVGLTALSNTYMKTGDGLRYDMRLTGLGAGEFNSDVDYWAYFTFAPTLGIDINTVLTHEQLEQLLVNNEGVHAMLKVVPKKVKKK